VTTLLLLFFLIGVVSGLRGVTPPAAVSWGAHLGWLHFAGTKLAFMNSPITLVIFTLGALAELFSDKLPKTPARTAAPGFITRMIFGALSAAALAVSAGGGVIIAAVLGIIGAVVGTYGGYYVRRAITSGGKIPDLPVALVEDLIAVVGAFLIVSHV
jgi:uncharacterized membrane protein